MAAKREPILVVGFVAVAVGILVFTILYIDGVFRGNGNLYRAHFKNAGGLQNGGPVRYAGGPPIGRVTKVGPDPQDPTQMNVEFRVESSAPVKTDSKVKIASLSELGFGRSEWPEVSMLNLPTNQDGCKGASLTLAFAGAAMEATP